MPSCREGLTGNTDAVFMVFEDAELSVNYPLLKAKMNTGIYSCRTRETNRGMGRVVEVIR